MIGLKTAADGEGCDDSGLIWPKASKADSIVQMVDMLDLLSRVGAMLCMLGGGLRIMPPFRTIGCEMARLASAFSFSLCTLYSSMLCVIDFVRRLSNQRQLVRLTMEMFFHAAGSINRPRLLLAFLSPLLLPFSSSAISLKMACALTGLLFLVGRTGKE